MADDCPKCVPGAPAWVMTFADLMSLLMCFFVLLLSFATMDVVRFKQMAASLKNAFGVQTEVPVYDMVKGTSVIAQHFSPATTEPTPLDEVRQTTESRENLEIPEEAKKKLEDEMEKIKQQNLESEAEKIRESLKDEITQGLISVETEEYKIIIRIREKGSFPSGSSVLNSGFDPVMKKITSTIKGGKGTVVIAGHTDNIPISTEWYRSNWELSTARAVTVAHEILRNRKVDKNRLVVEGHAETRPIVPNSSAANRAKNRRVEIALMQDDPT